MDKFLRFGFSGGLTYGINMGLTYLLIHTFIFTEKRAYLISIISITIINFFLALKFVFKKRYSHTTLSLYFVFLVIFSLLNYILVFSIKNYFTFLDLFSSIFIITTLIFFLKYFTYDKLVFNK